VFGVATDQLTVPADLDQIKEAYLEQLAVTEEAGGEAILMASRALATAAQGPADYLDVYRSVIDAARNPVMIHWLGEAFDPALAGYWGGDDPWQAVDTVIELAEALPDRISGIKVSLLDDAVEIHLRRHLPSPVKVFTGDDFNFLPLILGDETGHSHALLGVFDPIAPVAGQALAALDRGDVDAYREWLEPTVPFSRHLFTFPTYHYKTGITFLAYLNGHQDHFHMLEGAETARSLPHLCRLLVLADQASLLRDPDLAVARMEGLLA
jgi:dihydrodipicolinate synthase/N-acetylneuraminate lyase